MIYLGLNLVYLPESELPLSTLGPGADTWPGPGADTWPGPGADTRPGPGADTRPKISNWVLIYFYGFYFLVLMLFCLKTNSSLPNLNPDVSPCGQIGSCSGSVLVLLILSYTVS